MSDEPSDDVDMDAVHQRGMESLAQSEMKEKLRRMREDADISAMRVLLDYIEAFGVDIPKRPTR